MSLSEDIRVSNFLNGSWPNFQKPAVGTCGGINIHAILYSYRVNKVIIIIDRNG